MTSVLAVVPVVGSILGVTRQATTVMTSQFSFSRAVFLEWPVVAPGHADWRAAYPGCTAV